MARRLLLESVNGPAVRLHLLVDQNADETVSEAIPVPNAQSVALLVVYDDGVTAGEVILESAHLSDYAGDWAEEGSSSGGSNKIDRIVATGPMEWVRARINTAIADGDVNVYLTAIGEY